MYSDAAIVHRLLVHEVAVADLRVDHDRRREAGETRDRERPPQAGVAAPNPPEGDDQQGDARGRERAAEPGAVVGDEADQLRSTASICSRVAWRKA